MDVPRQLAVIRKAGDLKVHVAVHFVGIASVDELLDDLEHLIDVVSSLGEFVGRLDAQLLLVGPEPQRVELRNLRRRLALFYGGSDDLVFAAFQHLLAHVADIGNVLDVDHVQALFGQNAPDPVSHQV